MTSVLVHRPREDIERHTERRPREDGVETAVMQL